MRLKTGIIADEKSALIRPFCVICVLFFLIFISNSTVAQQATISGTITDSTGKALEGASIAIFGMPIATQTGADGKYSLSVPAQVIKLVFSYAGLKADTLNIKLNEGETRVVNRSLRYSVTELAVFTKEETSVTRVNMTTVNPKLI